MREIPTVLVSQLDRGRCDECDHGFIVMNRPWGLRQFTKLRAFADIREEYIFIVDIMKIWFGFTGCHATTILVYKVKIDKRQYYS